MAYIDQDRKKQLEPAIKALLKEYGLKGSLRISHHSTLILTISAGEIDFIGNYNETGERNHYRAISWSPAKGNIQANHYHLDTTFSGRAFEALDKIRDAMMVGNHDNSDPMSDYFDVGWWIAIHIGSWNKPYICTASAAFEKEAA